MRQCSICGKGYMNVTRRSHSMQATKTRLYPNIQWLKMPNGQRVRSCTKCMKTYHRKLSPVTV